MCLSSLAYVLWKTAKSPWVLCMAQSYSITALIKCMSWQHYVLYRGCKSTPAILSSWAAAANRASQVVPMASWSPWHKYGSGKAGCGLGGGELGCFWAGARTRGMGQGGGSRSIGNGTCQIFPLLLKIDGIHLRRPVGYHFSLHLRSAAFAIASTIIGCSMCFFGMAGLALFTGSKIGLLKLF